jgi:hypothetical protein
MQMVPRILVALVVPLGLVGPAGCDAAGDPELAEALQPLVVTAGTGQGPAGLDHGDLQPLGTLTSSSPSGTEVSLSFHPDPPTPGRLRLEFTLPEGVASSGGLSVDVVAPRMPAHGILRYPVPASAGGRASLDIGIPMAGLWAIYLNLDDGPDAAAFEIQVEGSTPDSRHPSGPTEPHAHAGHP